MTWVANAIDLAAQLAPAAIADDVGVRLSVHHMEFVGLDGQHLADWRARRAPLGMAPAQYREFCTTLFAAAQRDNLVDLDVRLKGSAAVIFSGRHKQMPATWSEYLHALNQALGRAPTASEEQDLRIRLDRFWAFQPVPRRRPFDSMHKLQLDPHRSDYDLQVSSDEIERRCSTILSLRPQLAPLRNTKYGFLDDALVALAAPLIMNWKNRWTATLGRQVAVKAFDRSGPENRTTVIGELSSHFRSEDWIVQPPRAGVD